MKRRTFSRWFVGFTVVVALVPVADWALKYDGDIVAWDAKTGYAGRSGGPPPGRREWKYGARRLATHVAVKLAIGGGALVWAYLGRRHNPEFLDGEFGTPWQPGIWPDPHAAPPRQWPKK